MDDRRLSWSSSYAELLNSSPDLFPIGLDARRERLCFVSMSRESYRASSFLDFRAVRKSRDSYLIGIDELLDAHRSDPSSRRVYYVMHAGFCCSTLLTRYLDLISDLFVLREPDLLRQVLMLEHQTYSRELLLRLSVRLLSRTYRAQQTAVIKCNDLCNYLAEELSNLDERSKILFVYTKLRVFLLAVLKSPERRRWVRSRLDSALQLCRPGPLSLRQADTIALTDAQAAALMWLSYEYVRRSLLRNMEGRVRLVDGDDVAYRPREALSSVANFFGARLRGEALERILSHWSRSKHSKYLLMPFDAELRLRDLAEADARFGAEADAGVEWAQPYHPNELS